MSHSTRMLPFLLFFTVLSGCSGGTRCLCEITTFDELKTVIADAESAHAQNSYDIAANKYLIIHQCFPDELGIKLNAGLMLLWANQSPPDGKCNAVDALGIPDASPSDPILEAQFDDYAAKYTEVCP